MNTLVIINGVTGAVGTACLARFSREHATVLYGLSRKAEPFAEFVNAGDAGAGKLPDRSLLCSIGADIVSVEACAAFASAIDAARFERIVFIHCVGEYPFELNDRGEVAVANDHDGDGIDDNVMRLSHDAFFSMADALASTGLPVTSALFGSVADKYKPAVHKSWWTVMDKVKEGMASRAAAGAKRSFVVLNISSVICPHEILTRPYVFIHTNADARFWLQPHEVAERVAMLTLSPLPGVTEEDLFHRADYYKDDYFQDDPFTDRKRRELGIAA